ncbi:MAG: excisionase family DNA-binding protein [Actinomycetota bacterium]
MTRSEVLAHKKTVDLQTAATYLGISRSSVRRRIAEGALRAYRVGPRSIRVYVEDLDAIMAPIGGGAV